MNTVSRRINDKVENGFMFLPGRFLGKVPVHGDRNYLNHVCAGSEKYGVPVRIV